MHLVESDDKRGVFAAQHLDAFDGLLLEPVHQVDDQDGDVAQGRAAVAQVGEGLVARRVDDQQAGETDVERLRLLHDLQRPGKQRHRQENTVRQKSSRLMMGKKGSDGEKDLRLQHEGLAGELGGADLLRDAAGLALLHVGVTDLVQQLRLAYIVNKPHGCEREECRWGW